MDINLSWKQSHILPTPEDFIKQSNTPVSSISLVRETRQEISDIFSGISDKLLVVVGPCSIHDPASALEYAEKLSQLDCKNLVIVMRAYFEKPRTVLGWCWYVCKFRFNIRWLHISSDCRYSQSSRNHSVNVFNIIFF